MTLPRWPDGCLRSAILGLATLLCGAVSDVAMAQGVTRDQVDEFIETLERGTTELERAHRYFEVAVDACDSASSHARPRGEWLESVETWEAKLKQLGVHHRELDGRARSFFEKWRDGLENVESEELRRLGARRLEMTRHRYESASNIWAAIINVYTPLTNALRRHVLDPSRVAAITDVRKHASDVSGWTASYAELSSGCASLLRLRWPHLCDAFLQD